MLIGVGRIVLDFYNNEKASLKHQKLKELCADLRKKFNVSALEVADFADAERCVIGFAAVFPESSEQGQNEKDALALVDRICREIDQTSFARVTVEDTDLLRHGDFG